MDNKKILSEIISSIRQEMAQRNLVQEDLEKLCREKGSPVSQSTISNVFLKPSSAKVSTLLKICDGLDLSLFAIFRSINNKIQDEENSNLIYNMDHPAFDGYRSNMYIYFCKTDSALSYDLLCGEIKFGDFYHTNECMARVKLDINELDNDGRPKFKEYEGTVVINQNEALFLHLTSNKLGDVWSLVFNHGIINQNTLACSYGCGVTLSAGRNTRYPSIHYVCLSQTKLSSEQEEIVKNRLRIHNKDIVITDHDLQSFLANESMDPVFRENLEQCTARYSSKAYVVPLSTLSTFVDRELAYKMSTQLLRYSSNPTTYRIYPEEDARLFRLLQSIQL